MRGRTARRALLAACAVMLAWHAALFAAAEELGGWEANLVAALVPAAIVVGRGWWREAAVVPLPPRRSWWVLLPALALACVYVVDGPTGSAAAWRDTLTLVVAVGVSEELYARGVMQHLLEPLGRARAVLWTGLLFGLGHGLSGAWFERPLDDTLVQVVETAAFGACYAALRFEIGTLWPLVLLHALDNLLQLRTPGALAFGVQVLVALAYAGYAWRLARGASLARAGAPRHG
jgi:uncharacterized protein